MIVTKTLHVVLSAGDGSMAGSLAASFVPAGRIVVTVKDANLVIVILDFPIYSLDENASLQQSPLMGGCAKRS
ncbi:hypothetical protein OAS39_13375 [Pirellulales bacterium]|nr:hypothetical protein [Pirellulales bacterium]